MADELISEIISPEVWAQFSQLHKETTKAVGDMARLSEAARNAFAEFDSNSNFAEFIKTARSGTAANAGMTDSLKKLDKTLDESNKLLAKFTNSTKEQIAASRKMASSALDEAKVATEAARKRNIEERLAIALQREQDRQNKANAASNQFVSDSIKGMSKQLTVLINDYQRLGAAERDATAGQALLKQIQDLDKQVKAADASVGRFQRRVGEYPNSTEALSDITQELIKLRLAGKSGSDEFKDLQKKAAGLNTTLTSTDTVLGNITSATVDASNQFNALNAQLEQLEATGQTETDQFYQLREQLQGLSGDIKSIGNTIEKANFGELIMQGIGIGTGVEIAQQMIGSVKELIGESVMLAKEAEGVSNAFAKLNDYSLLGNLREATNGTISDLELMKKAIQFRNFNLPIEQLGTALKFAKDRARETGESVEFLTESITTGLARQSPLILDNLGISVVKLRDEIAKTGDFTTAAFSVIAQESAKAGPQVDLLADKVDRLNASLANNKLAVGQEIVTFLTGFTALLTFDKKVLDTLGKQEEMKQAQKIFQETLLKNQESWINSYKISSEEGRKAIAADIKAYEELTTKRLQRLDELRAKGRARTPGETQEFFSLDNEKAGLTARLIMTKNFFDVIAKIESDAKKARQKNIEDMNVAELTAYKERTQAFIDSFTLQDLADKNKLKQRNGYLKTIVDIDKAIAKIQGDIDKEKNEAQLQGAKDLINAKYNLLQQSLEAEKQHDGAIMDSSEYTLETRLTAYKYYYAAVQKLAELDRDKSIELEKEKIAAANRRLGQSGVTGAERGDLQAQIQAANINIEAAEKKHNANLEAIQREGGNKMQSIIKSNEDKIITLRETGLKEQLITLETGLDGMEYATAIAYRKGEINEQQYRQQLKDIQRTYQMEQDQLTVDFYANMLSELKLTTEKEKEVLDKYYAAVKKLRQDDTANQLQDAADLKEAKDELRQLELQAISESISAAKSIVDGYYDAELQKLEAKGELIDENAQKEIDAINNSMLSETEKERKILSVEAQAAAQRKALQQEENRIKRNAAIAERAAALANIAQQAAIAEVGALKYLTNPVTAGAYPFIAALIAGIAVAQAAAVLAQPLPEYAEGTEFHPGGLARFGEAGTEYVKEPNKPVYRVDTDTIAPLPRGTKVFTEADYIAGQMGIMTPRLLTTVGAGTDNSRLESTIKAELQATREAISGMPQTVFNWSERGLEKTVISGHSKVTYINKISK